MFGRYDFFEYVWLILVFWFALIPLIMVSVMSDKIDITINNDYRDEYNQCEEDLERTQPICPACKCSGNVSIIYPFLVGVIFMFFFYDLVLFPKFVKRNLEKLKKAERSYKTDSKEEGR